MPLWPPLPPLTSTSTPCSAAGAVVANVAGKAHVDPARTADSNLSVVFGIQVQQDFSFHPPLLRAPSAPVMPGFFIDGEQTARVAGWGTFLALHHGEHRGHAKSVVGTQCGAFGTDPVAIHPHANAFGVEVKIRVVVFLAYHVDMALQHDGLAVFHAGGGGFAHQDIAHFVGRPSSPGLGPGP